MVQCTNWSLKYRILICTFPTISGCITTENMIIEKHVRLWISRVKAIWEKLEISIAWRHKILSNTSSVNRILYKITSIHCVSRWIPYTVTPSRAPSVLCINHPYHQIWCSTLFLPLSSHSVILTPCLEEYSMQTVLSHLRGSWMVPGKPAPW